MRRSSASRRGRSRRATPTRALAGWAVPVVPEVPEVLAAQVEHPAQAVPAELVVQAELEVRAVQVAPMVPARATVANPMRKRRCLQTG